MSKIKVPSVSIQGQLGSFSHQAALAVCQPATIIQRTSFDQAFDDLAQERAPIIVVPIENSTYGSIYENYDHLAQQHGHIVAETYTHIRLNLIGLPGARLENLREIHSHPVALGQISRFQKRHPHIKFLPHHDTAGAVEHIKGVGDVQVAACAGDLAANLNQLQILQEEIEDNRCNFTRFFALAGDHNIVHPQPANKTTIQFELGDESGSLYRTLRSFADRGLSLSRIESRPIIHTNWNYRFYLDIAAGTQTDKLQHALAEMRDYVKDQKVAILGSYYSTGMPEIKPRSS